MREWLARNFLLLLNPFAATAAYEVPIFLPSSTAAEVVLSFRGLRYPFLRFIISVCSQREKRLKAYLNVILTSGEREAD